MNKKELEEIIAEEKKMYVRNGTFHSCFTHKKRYLIWKYISLCRKVQYQEALVNTSSGIGAALNRANLWRLTRRKNIAGEKCGIEIANNCVFGRRFDIWHGNVVISGAKLGDDCIIRGNTVIGNKGLKKYNGEPSIGNGVEIGAGAMIIGNVTVADNCEIGENAVVTKDFLEPGTIIVGIPGHKLERR